MAMTIVNQSGTGITYTLFAASASGGSTGSGSKESGSRGSGSKESGSRGSGSPAGTASGVTSSGGMRASGSDSYTVAHDWMQAPGHNLSVSGG